VLEIITATLVIGLTAADHHGRCFRYAGASLTWYDEVASIGLVWLTYYGAALGALKGAHIGFPGIVNAMPPRWRVPIALFAEACVFLFFGILAWTGWQVLMILQGVNLVSLPWVPVQVTQSVIPIGAVLFMIAEAMRLPEIIRDARGEGFVDHELKEALGETTGTPLEHGRRLGGGGLPPTARRRRQDRTGKDRPMTIGYMLAGMLALTLLNVPIAVALGLVAIAAIVLIQGSFMLPNIALTMFQGASSFPLLAIPLFILAGGIMNASSISRRLVAFASALLGFIRGGLSFVTIGASMFFAEISGSAVAGVAALGSILIPAMERKGYSKEFAAAISSSAASLAIILPPSIPMILYAVMAQQSVVQMFVAGLLPGFVGALGLAIAAYIQARRYNFPVEEKFQVSRVWSTFKDAAWALTLPIIILGGIFGGFVTATEGARASPSPRRSSSRSSSTASSTSAPSTRRRSTAGCRPRW
jgi:TRAP-type C4-dicarboxylate transport system permease small subunit